MLTNCKLSQLSALRISTWNTKKSRMKGFSSAFCIHVCVYIYNYIYIHMYTVYILIHIQYIYIYHSWSVNGFFFGHIFMLPGDYLARIAFWQKMTWNDASPQSCWHRCPTLVREIETRWNFQGSPVFQRGVIHPSTSDRNAFQLWKVVHQKHGQGWLGQ